MISGPPLSSIVTSVLTAPCSTFLTLPFRKLRALIFILVSCECEFTALCFTEYSAEHGLQQCPRLLLLQQADELPRRGGGVSQSPSFDVPVESHELAPRRGKHRSAAIPAAGRSTHDGLREPPVEIVDQHPGAPVRHPQLTRGRGDRSGVPDRLEQRDLSRTDRPGSALYHA